MVREGHGFNRAAERVIRAVSTTEVRTSVAEALELVIRFGMAEAMPLRQDFKLCSTHPEAGSY